MKPSLQSGALAVALCMLIAGACAQDAQDGAPYLPKFARERQPAQALLDNCAKPVWPRVSLRNGQTGTVVLRFTIAPNGRLINQEVLRSTGFPLLDQAAMEGLSKCRFRPGSVDGKPVQSLASMQYVWTLE